MLSKNNWNEQFRKQEPKKQRFTLKKLTIGVASVLIGFTFMGVSAANADADVPANNTPVETTPAPVGNQNSASATNAAPASASTDSSQGSSATGSAASGANTPASDTNTFTLPNQAQPAITPSELGASLAETQTQDVNDWQSFVNAMNDANVGTIKLSNDVNVTNNVNGQTTGSLLYPDQLKLSGTHISRSVTIVGNNHALDFGKYYLTLNDSDNNPWKITLKDLTLKRESTPNSWKASPFELYNTKNGQITLENVNANLKNSGLAYAADENAQNSLVVLKGTNNIIIQSDNDTPFEAVHSTGDLTIADGATVNFNNAAAKAALHVTGALNNKNVSGLVANDENNIVTLTVGQNAKINMEMGSGNSAALFAGQMHIEKNANVEINTHQDGARISSNGGDFNAAEAQQAFSANPSHVGAVTLGWVKEPIILTSSRKVSNSYIENGATLKITRPSTSQSTVTPLISFASANTAASGIDFKFHVNDGATLDLQDAASKTGTTYNRAEFNNAKYLGNQDNLAYPGLISMWGSGATDDLEFGKVKNVNLQRLGTERGILISLHAGMFPSVSSPVTTDKLGNKVFINQGGNDYIPLNYVGPDGQKLTWYIKDFASYNLGGNDFSYNFVPSAVDYYVGTDGQPYLTLRKPKSQGGAFGYDFAHSNGSVVLNDGTSLRGGNYEGPSITPLISSFGENFNWWNPSQISFGTDYYNDAEKYTPQGGIISVNEGHALTGGPASTTNPTDAQHSVIGFTDGNGQPATPDVSSYTWKEKPNTTVPGNKAGIVTVTYGDGSKDDVTVTVHVKSQAEMYDPQGQDVHATVGNHTALSAETAITNKPDLPAGTTYAWSTEPNTSKSGVVPSVVNVNYPDGSQDQVPVNVIVGDTTKAETKTDADKNDPQGKTVDTTIGKLPDPSTAVTWPAGQPTKNDPRESDPTYTWSQTPDVWTKGNPSWCCSSHLR